MKIRLVSTLLMMSVLTVTIHGMEELDVTINKVTKNIDLALQKTVYVAILTPPTHAIVARKQITSQGVKMTACKFSLKSKKEKIDLDPKATFNLLQKLYNNQPQ